MHTVIPKEQYIPPSQKSKENRRINIEFKHLNTKTKKGEIMTKLSP